MNSFRTSAPDGATRIPFSLMRVQKGKTVKFWSVSSAPTVIGTHWNGMRSVKHAEESCEFCEGGQPIRWRGYLFGVGESLKQIMLFEYTGGVSKQIEDFWKDKHSLRGCGIALHRPGKRKNSPLTVSFAEFNKHSEDLPAEPDMIGVLMKMYDVTGRIQMERDVKEGLREVLKAHTG